MHRNLAELASLVKATGLKSLNVATIELLEFGDPGVEKAVMGLMADALKRDPNAAALCVDVQLHDLPFEQSLEQHLVFHWKVTGADLLTASIMGSRLSFSALYHLYLQLRHPPWCSRRIIPVTPTLCKSRIIRQMPRSRPLLPPFLWTGVADDYSPPPPGPGSLVSG